ncbi:hypothetical protein BGZ74_005933, partial [Mortierella antarctica]
MPVNQAGDVPAKNPAETTIAMRAMAQKILDRQVPKLPPSVGHSLPVCPKLSNYSRNWRIMEREDIKCVRVIPSPEALAIALNLSRKSSEMSVRFGEENRVFTFAALVQMSN